MISTYACHRTSTSITDADLAAIVEAGGLYLDEYYAGDYSAEPPQVSLWDEKTELPDGVKRTDFCDLAPDVEPGALAWHTEEPDPVTGKPRPVLKIPVNRILAQHGGSILDGSGSITAAFTHELGETDQDPSCNKWSDTGDGKTEMAFEIADPVQNFCFEVTLADGRKASVSAYVKNAYWDSATPEDPTGETLCRGVPAGCLTRPYQIADSAPGANDQGGGYAAMRGVGRETQIGGMEMPTAAIAEENKVIDTPEGKAWANPEVHAKAVARAKVGGIWIIGNSPRATLARKALEEGRGRIGKRSKLAIEEMARAAKEFDTSDITKVDGPKS